MNVGVEGVEVGHWSDPVARTGCTVVLLPPGTVASGEVRGGAPATREFALLEPHRLVQHVDAVVLSGGSAFGLAAADGVVHWCEAHGRGFVTPAATVPIVVAMGLYDLAVGDASVRPGPAEGEAACRDARPGPSPTGAVGAGTGATVDKWRGRPRPGGLGTATVADGALVLSAVVAVNAYGGVVDPGEEPDADGGSWAAAWPGANTTIGVVLTNAALDKVGCLAVAAGGHDGLARAVFPPHTSVDGDAVVACATGTVTAAVDRVRALAVVAYATAIRSSVAPRPAQ